TVGSGNGEDCGGVVAADWRACPGAWTTGFGSGLAFFWTVGAAFCWAWVPSRPNWLSTTHSVAAKMATIAPRSSGAAPSQCNDRLTFSGGPFAVKTTGR